MSIPALSAPIQPRHLARRVTTLFTLGMLVLATQAPLAAGNKDRHPDHPAPKPEFSALYVFGDSLSDTGRTFAAIGIPPAPYYEGRVSNGHVWAEYLAPVLGLDYNPLDNFSWAGANTGRINTYPGLPGMLDELDEYIAGLGRHPRADKKALYVVFGGANDFFRILQGGEYPETVIGEAVGNIAIIVRRLRLIGAEHIVVVDLPDIGLTPRARGMGAEAALTATYLSTLFNTTLDAALDGMRCDDVVRVSAFDLLNAVASAPGTHGITDVTTPGIFDPAGGDGHLFWDDIHPTTQVHALFAEAIATALDRVEKKRPRLRLQHGDFGTAFAVACAGR